MYIDKKTLDEFNKKYGLILLNGSRYYKADLTQHQMIFEFSSPLYFSIGSELFYEGSWKNLVVDVLQYLDTKNPKSVRELLSYECPWGNQEIFSTQYKSNYTHFKSCYLNTNNTATHAVWLLQLILNIYDVDVSTCELVIRRYQGVEPDEIQKYYISYNKSGFKKLLERRGKSQQAIETIIKNIDSMSQHLLRERTKSGMNEYDFFLFDNYKLFKQCKSRAISYACEYYLYNWYKVKIVENNLQFLDDFYKNERDTDESMMYIDFTD